MKKRKKTNMEKLLNYLSSKLSFLLITREYRFTGKLPELKNQLNNEKYGFRSYYFWRTEELEFRSLFSLGTLQVNKQPASGITLYGKILEEKENEILLKIYTRVTDGMLFVAFTPLLFLLIRYSEPDFPIYLMLVLMVIPLFFFWVYRAQEKALLGAVVNMLELRRMN